MKRPQGRFILFYPTKKRYVTRLEEKDDLNAQPFNTSDSFYSV